MSQKVIGVTGFKNSGKTTLVERLVEELDRTRLEAHLHHQARASYIRYRSQGARQLPAPQGRRPRGRR